MMQLLLKNLSEYTGVKTEFNELPTVDIGDAWLDIFDLAIPQFAAKERKCKEGNFPCGGRCISGKAKRKDGTPVQCRKMLPGQAKNYAEFLKLQKKNTPKSTKSEGKKQVKPAASETKAIRPKSSTKAEEKPAKSNSIQGRI